MSLSMAIRLFQHRETWYVELDGKRRSLKTKDRGEARRLYTQIRKEYLAGKLGHLTGKCLIALGQYRDEYLKWAEPVQPRSTFRANRLALSKLVHHAGEKITLDRVGLKHLDDLIAQCKRDGLSTASINNYIRHAKVVLKKAVEWGHVQTHPLSGAKELPKESSTPTFIDKPDLPKFIASIQDVELRRMVVAYLATGRRRTELLSLEWKDVDLEHRRYFISKSKNHLSRWYPMNSMFEAVLHSMDVREGRVFTRFAHPDSVSHAVKDALVAFGLGHLHLHHLRHTFASHRIMAGVDLKTIKELMGHSSLSATMIYAHISDDHLRDAVEVNLGPVDLVHSIGAPRSKSTPKK